MASPAPPTVSPAPNTDGEQQPNAECTPHQELEEPGSVPQSAHQGSEEPESAPESAHQGFVFGLGSPAARQRQLLFSEYLADVVFQVGEAGELIHAHKFILMIASKVFFDQLNGDFKNPVVAEIFESAIFKEILRYIYCEKLDLNPDNIVDLYAASKMYLLTGLKDICENFLNKALNAANVLKVFNANQQYAFGNVDGRCLAIIRDDPVTCFQSEAFLTLSQSALESIAACRTMNCQKAQLLSAIKKWRTANDSKAFIKVELEDLQCEKIFAFSAFRYSTDVWIDLRINVRSKMYLHGIGVFIGLQQRYFDPHIRLEITVGIQPGDVVVSRTVSCKKSLYVEEILFRKVTITNECRIFATVSAQDLFFCLEEFVAVDPPEGLGLTVTNVGAEAQYSSPPVQGYDDGRSRNKKNRHGRTQPNGEIGVQPRQGTNCVAYLLYSLEPTV